MLATQGKGLHPNHPGVQEDRPGRAGWSPPPGLHKPVGGRTARTGWGRLGPRSKDRVGQIRLGFILAGSLVVGLSGPRSLAGVSLSAVGLAGRVELSWQATDDDYSGFILERSLTPESGFVPIHSGILEPVVTRHEDDSVPAGQTCFYRVLAVNDTGTETSNPAAAAAFDNLPPTISHLPVESWEPGQPIELEAAVTDSLQVKTVEWHYRRLGEADYTTMPMLPDGKGPRGPWSVRLNRIPVTADTLIAQDFSEHTATVEPSISPAPYGTQAGPWDLHGYGGTTVAYGLITNGVFTTGTNWVQYEDRNWVVVYVGKQLQESPGRIRARVSWQKADEGTAVGTFVIGLGRRGRYWWSDCVHIRWNQMTDEIQSLYVDEFTTDGGAMQNLGSAAFPGVPLGQISELDVWHIDDTLCLAVNGVERLRITHSKIRTQWGPDVFWELFSWSRPGWWAAVHGVGFYREPPPGGRYLTGTDAPVAVAPGLEYYISASDGVNVSRIGTPDAPLRIQVDDAPVLTSITPAETTGEEPRTVLLNGRRFADGAVVTFDGRTALETVWRGATQVECRVPPHFPARVDVRLTNPDSQSASLPGGFQNS
ncbi:MAG: IPT/TIG domain-containing protein [Verrucomicrobiales bacterium]|nr:IPT/TIG domain-containing protein [Verrucomicrobiales bacterium]